MKMEARRGCFLSHSLSTPPFCICTRNLRFIVQKNSKWFWLLKSYHSLEIFLYWLPWFFHAKSSHLQPGTTAVFAALRRAARYRSTKLIFSPTFSRWERCPAAWSPYHTWCWKMESFPFFQKFARKEGSLGISAKEMDQKKSDVMLPATWSRWR